ncbi:orotidine 5'-phosphate decarboxylase / HUMPS family protein [Sphaerisporangium sp. NPDC051017]|uniref:orotidine 5'-phosphate decarboxylase / HUMPS family protein n=1 Tax=Sphaerisporangium sp. NPDC051017 TaxID=3154636 RepID=UPI00342E8C93
MISGDFDTMRGGRATKWFIDRGDTPVGGVVARWTGLEARALREAKRMSVRDFAAYIGLNINSVSTWERRGSRAQLRFETQQLLDTALAQLNEAGQRRFHLILADLEAPSPAPDRDGSTAGTVNAWPESSRGAANQDLGGRSVQRTTTLAAAMQTSTGSLPFLPPEGATEQVRRFLASVARAFVVNGPSGCGKTTMIGHLVSGLAASVDSQIHTVDSWPLGQLDLPSQILRYASMPRGDDPLLSLEQQASRLDRTLLVIIDGINSREQLHEVSRQLDMVLRQVTEPTIRFILVIRTPPDLELTAHPVLAASIYEPDPRDRGVSLRLTPWRYEQARRVWEAAAEPGQTPFTELPPSVQQLATVPLYLALLHAAGRTGPDRPATAFRLVDHCVQTILRRGGADRATTVEALSDLAIRQSEILPPPLLPATALRLDRGSPPSMPTDLPQLVVSSASGPRFAHDIIREYFAAVRIADLLVEKGRSVASASALNDLAEQATASATARGVFEFVICRIDERDPQLASAIALSPTISADTALPLLLRARTATMSSTPVLRSCATRSTQPGGLDLARALLSGVAVSAALGETYSEWVITVLRTFGQSVWAEMLVHLEQSLDADMAAQLLATADLERGEEATFFARHAALFHGISSDDWLAALVSHTDWRVRAALAEGLLGESNRHQRFTLPVIRRLAADDDYKVRAAVARALATTPFQLCEQLQTLIADPNWHVRANLLRGLLSLPNEPWNDEALAASLLADKEQWDDAPADAALLRHRLLLLTGGDRADESATRDRALFGLLREFRTGWTTLSEQTLERLALEGQSSRSWLVQREANAIAATRHDGRAIAGEVDGRARREDFRRLRGQHAVQVALDLRDLDQALHVAEALAAAGVDFIEVGDPLIKQVGVRAIERVKQVVGATRVVAEMMSADWGRDQVEQAAEAGADVVLLIGPATAASVSAAVEAGRRLGTPILLDVATSHATQQWVRDMERAGVDGFTITSNIDIGIGVSHPLARARTLRSWSRLPVAVSGGFSTTDLPVIASQDWDILIVGRSITEAVRPRSAAEQFLKIVRTQREG